VISLPLNILLSPFSCVGMERIRVAKKSLTFSLLLLLLKVIFFILRKILELLKLI